MAKTYTIKANGMEFSAPTQAEAIALAKAYEAECGKKPTTSGKGKVKDTAFTKHDGTVVMTTKAQAEAWTKHRDGYADRVGSREANLAKFEADRKAYKPSQALIKAIKANPTLTRKDAKELGFVGTSNDLWNLKYGTNGCVKKGTFNK